jgi:type II secretory pathway pseudopilin PulG
MRISVAMYAGFFSMILLVAILSSIISYTSYSDTVQQNLEESMEFAVRMLQEDYAEYYTQDTAFNDYLENKVGKGLTVSFGSEDTSKTEPERTTAKLKENFVKYLTTNLNANITNLDVKIYGADATTGVLSAEVTATFKYPTGNVGTVSCDRTVIIDKYLKPTKY